MPLRPITVFGMNEYLKSMRCERKMFVLLLMVLPCLAEGVSSHEEGCVLPPASKENFFVTTERKTWYQQYQYDVPGLFGWGCSTYTQSPRPNPKEMDLVGHLSQVPLFPLYAVGKFTGNRLDKVYKGVWNGLFSGPYNTVYSHREFIILHYCFLGYDAADIFTTAKEPSKELWKKIWKVVDEHPEVDRRKLKKVVC
ncbi:uncharacterized protein LOC126199683 [Schistocerca nitens]|uniref:uncharacterized protein LOC126199683 n=1 Tax=Schistocerca nitens TaxID=7011 RepID=UPI00211936F9|nr:uncharacterized protein LOC126199683 [Schistocerca nitens]